MTLTKVSDLHEHLRRMAATERDKRIRPVRERRLVDLEIRLVALGVATFTSDGEFIIHG